MSCLFCQPVRTFYVASLGCKVNQYESLQIAAFLLNRGLVQVGKPALADLRIVHSCSVTVQAARKSRQLARHLGRPSRSHTQQDHPPCYLVISGCWPSTDRAAAERIPHVSAVIDHSQDIAGELDRLLALWRNEDRWRPAHAGQPPQPQHCLCPESWRNKGWMNQTADPARQCSLSNNTALCGAEVKENPAETPIPGTCAGEAVCSRLQSATGPDSRRGSAPVIAMGLHRLPQLGPDRQNRQRALLKVQDGCDAHCSFCVIPRIRPVLWSKPIDDVLAEAQALVSAGHQELVLTGICLGAYGQPTAVRRRQPEPPGTPLARLVRALCSRVAGLRRVRLSGLEPGDLGEELLEALACHPQVVPHFHLPLQSGSEYLLRRMNRQYSPAQFLEAVRRLRERIDDPALTTDIIVGFPGETEERFQETLDLVDRVRFLQIHAFPFSPRPGTPAASRQGPCVPAQTVRQRIRVLNDRSAAHGLEYRQRFVGRCVQVIFEPGCRNLGTGLLRQCGRSERYFAVQADYPEPLAGRCASVQIKQASPDRTLGTVVGILPFPDPGGAG